VYFLIGAAFFTSAPQPKGAHMEDLIFRKATFGQLDLAERSVPLVLTTETPVQRQGYLEILDMKRVDLSRGDLPLIESHNSDKLNIGIVRQIRVDGDKLRGVAVFGTSARANEVLADVESGIIRGISIGYQITDEGDQVPGQPLARSFGFMPFECSIVAVPADTKAGFYRSRKTLSLKSQGNTNMETISQTPYLETRNHAAEISAIARTIPGGAELALRAIETGQTVEEFQQIALKHLASKPLPTSDIGGHHNPVIDTSGAAVKVLRNASDIRSHYATRQGGGEDIGLIDFVRGAARMKTTEAASRALSVGTDSAGGYTVPVATMPGVLEALTPASSLIQAGVGILPLGEGAKSYNFAALDALPTAAWRAENGVVSESAPTFKNIAVTPHDLSFMVKMSRELLADSPNAEQALQVAIGQAMAIELDRAGLLGSGTAPEPRGLKNTSGIQTVTSGTNGAVLASYANFFSGLTALMGANAPMPNAAIMAPRSLVKLGGLVDTTNQPLQVPGMLQGIKLLQTSQLPINQTVGTSTDCSDIFLGDFSKMFFAMREQINIQVLNELYADYGQIAFVCHARVDVLVQYPQAFCLISGVR